MSREGSIQWRGVTLEYSVDVTNWGSGGSWDEPPEGIEFDVESLTVGGEDALWLMDSTLMDEVIGVIGDRLIENAIADRDEECDI